MADEDTEPKQKTPKGHEIPVPKREDVLRDFGKIIEPERQEPEPPSRKG